MSTSTTTLAEPTSSSPLLNSTSSLGSSHSHQAPSVTRTYKTANQLFLTRQVQEALETLQPLLSAPASEEASSPTLDDAPNGFSAHHGPSTAPIATASRTARIRVWSLYISILNEVIEMGVETGKQTFGAGRWRELASKAKDGSVWEEVVQNGYGGGEGSVDPDVVANLATLLLAHAPSQKMTQQRLETYLSSYDNPNLDVASAMERQKNGLTRQHSNGTSTPRDLNSRLKILEIYTLHVLPRNQEWEYAKEFISMSEVFDDDRREAFTQLEDARRRDGEMRKAQQAKLEQGESQKKLAAASQTSEHDFGVDRSRIGSGPQSHRNGSTLKDTAPHSSRPAEPSRPSATHKNRSSAAGRRPKTPPPTFYHRISFLLAAMQRGLIVMGQNLRSHPMMLLRMVAFLVAFVMAFTRRDVRDRLARVRDSSWDKVKRTIGMGVKVSYV